MVPILMAPETGAEIIDPSVIREDQEGVMLIQAQNIILAQILDEFYRNFQVEINGLAHRENDSITFSCEAQTMEDALKHLLRHLGENNYAFEFLDDQLRRVSVLPEAGDEYPSLPLQEERVEAVEPKQMVNVVQIMGVVENSQAQDQGLLKGDLIVEYDGIMIRDSRKLVKATQKKSAAESVTITVLRDQIPMQFVLDAGFIGVRIRNQSVPNEEVDNYF
jgi:hypothetical protein